MVNYGNGKIYKIVCNVTGLVYIGSTTQNLSKRLTSHKCDFGKWKKNKSRGYISSYKVLENDNFDIILIEDYPCERKEQLIARERYWKEKTKCVNLRNPHRTEEQKIEQKHEIYLKWIENPDNVKKNREKVKLWRETYPEKRKAQTTIDYQCECGALIKRVEKARHLRSNKHIETIKILETY